MKKLVVVGVSLLAVILFISASLTNVVEAQSIVKASAEDKYIEYKISFFGIPGQKSHTIWLTREQAEEVEQLLDKINARIYNASSRDKARNILNQAIIELNAYGLLKGLTVEQAQALYVDSAQEKSLTKNLPLPFVLKNSFCFIFGSCAFAEPYNAFTPIGPLVLLSWFIYHRTGREALMILLQYISFLNPIRILNFIDLTYGEMYSIGLKGLVNIEEDLLLGYTGLMFYSLLRNRVHLLGFSVAVIDFE